MIKLLINTPSKEKQPNSTNFGGLPVKGVDQDIKWPKCETCSSEMEYQGKIKTDIGLELIFMCQNDPGMCDEWDANEGGNKVLVIADENLEYFNPETETNTTRNTAYSATIFEIEADSYDEAREKCEESPRDILGALYGEPDWIQNDETPNCDCCDEKMRFVAQLEEGPDHKTAMNFGGAGVGYLFDCRKGNTSKFLWQC
ncbi:hypothetical protein [Maribacter sp. Asnod2-G09]|uniref:hypothetical protein n=1 Tax=Maribacter sp. Asnod2-G09 TaxID=3160577 RepID=UPI003867B4BB